MQIEGDWDATFGRLNITADETSFGLLVHVMTSKGHGRIRVFRN